jgi:K+-transporting ATPase ATPase B chain
VTEQEIADAAQLSSLADETPEGGRSSCWRRSVRLRGRELAAHGASSCRSPRRPGCRASTSTAADSQRRRDAIERYVDGERRRVPGAEGDRRPHLTRRRHAAGRRGRTRRSASIHLKDIVKGGIRDRFTQLRAMGIKTVMITGDNPLTAASIANEAGVDDFLAEATPKTRWRSSRRSRRTASSSR